MTAVAAKAFTDCTNLKSATIGSNVTKIGNKAFQGCTNLTKVTIKNSVETIGNKAFYNCSKLKSITIKSQALTSVGNNAKSTAVITVPGSKLSDYRTLLEGKGQGSKVAITS